MGKIMEAPVSFLGILAPSFQVLYRAAKGKAIMRGPSVNFVECLELMRLIARTLLPSYSGLVFGRP